jgi:hypothetical protein
MFENHDQHAHDERARAPTTPATLVTLAPTLLLIWWLPAALTWGFLWLVFAKGAAPPWWATASLGAWVALAGFVSWGLVGEGPA